MSGAQ